MSAPVVYEVNLSYSGVVVAAFDEWLEAHVEKMLEIDGFVSASISSPSADAAANDPDAHRTVQYRLDSHASLEAYLEKLAPQMRAEGLARYGDALVATRRVLTTSNEIASRSRPLTGQYCANCGQRNQNRMISLLELVRDFVGDLFELDSRIWRSLIPLLFRPGVLTLEYLSGRRVRYTPPLRMYLVLSLLFFVVVTTGNSIHFDSDDEEPTEEQRVETAAEAVRALKEINAPQALIDDIEAEITSLPEPETSNDVGPLSISPDCQVSEFPPELQWLNRPAVIERITSSCKRLKREGGAEAFAKDLLGNVPTMMFCFLPVLALVMKLLYAASRRYYVEHLLFFVHFHSYFYLAAAVTVGVSRLPDGLFPGQGAVAGLLTAALVLYSPYYLFRSMRVVYAQHWLVTFIKFVVLNVAYFTGLLITFALTALVTALFV